MKKVLYWKFLAVYAVFGFLSFFLISTWGSSLIEDRLISEISDRLYTQGSSITDNDTVKYFNDEISLQTLYDSLSTVADFQNTQIRVINPSGNILLNTEDALRPISFDVIEDFDPAAFGPKYYEISTFFNEFSTTQLNVMVPITNNMETKGYVSLHLPMELIYELREELLRDVLWIFIGIFLLSLMILGLFTITVYRPLQKIITGTMEYAMGNLKYKINVDTNDEMGYLASTMNFMGEELLKHNEYQKQFIANVSHDFRSPLTSIKGYAEAISDGTIPPELYPKYLSIITSEAERLDKLTRSMLTLSNMSKHVMLNVTTFDINNLIKSSIAVFEVICQQKKISIELVLTDVKLFVSGDMGKIQQVIYNLVDNAIKFSPRNSTITIETTEKHGKVYVSVKDMGIGIPKDSQNKIWDRFYKIDSSRGMDRKGTGLGLAIVKEIITAHEQNINVISTEGVGTEFIFTLNKA